MSRAARTLGLFFVLVLLPLPAGAIARADAARR
jgi:hypothetical protein